MAVSREAGERRKGGGDGARGEGSGGEEGFGGVRAALAVVGRREALTEEEVSLGSLCRGLGVLWIVCFARC